MCFNIEWNLTLGAWFSSVNVGLWLYLSSVWVAAEDQSKTYTDPCCLWLSSWILKCIYTWPRYVASHKSLQSPPCSGTWQPDLLKTHSSSTPPLSRTEGYRGADYVCMFSCSELQQSNLEQQQQQKLRAIMVAPAIQYSTGTGKVR